ncbi:hypothetical protein CCACVL1_00647, partial [Corchorus capsularis]
MMGEGSFTLLLKTDCLCSTKEGPGIKVEFKMKLDCTCEDCIQKVCFIASTFE